MAIILLESLRDRITTFAEYMLGCGGIRKCVAYARQVVDAIVIFTRQTFY
jgi:hypothetical protein